MTGSRASGSNQKKRAAIVTPQHRFPLRHDEMISLEQMRRHLSGFDRFLICPESSNPELPEFKLIRVPDLVLSSEWHYNQHLLERSFYEQFVEYDYILIYQLDCLIFSSDLLSWCDKSWDYVGAPWFHHYANDATDGFWAVGNGGLSLRHVRSHIEVLTSRRRAWSPRELAEKTSRLKNHPRLRSLFCAIKKIAHQFGYKNPRVTEFLKEYSRNPQLHEDLFWSHEARRFKPDFVVPMPEDALPFAFECVPQYCFEANRQKLPFGCHAWPKFDRGFWERHLALQ